MKKMILYGGFLMAAIAIAGCNSESTNHTTIDTAAEMPVVTPPVADTSSVIITPLPNDDNVILPDSINQ